MRIKTLLNYQFYEMIMLVKINTSIKKSAILKLQFIAEYWYKWRLVPSFD